MGDSLGAGIVYALSKHELPPLPNETTEMMEVNVESPGKRKEPNGAEEEVATIENEAVENVKLEADEQKL